MCCQRGFDMLGRGQDIVKVTRHGQNKFGAGGVKEIHLLVCEKCYESAKVTAAERKNLVSIRNSNS